MARRIHNKKEKKEFRKELRRSLTPAEAFLWNHLKQKKLERRKFRRQHSIEDFIVDFFCYEENLIIELDGEGHNNPDQIEYDEVRTKRLNNLGYTVLRFENKIFFDSLTAVLNEIKGYFSDSTTSSSIP
jgi:very-short-patch-repair endonuclease